MESTYCKNCKYSRLSDDTYHVKYLGGMHPICEPYNQYTGITEDHQRRILNMVGNCPYYEVK